MSLTPDQVKLIKATVPVLKEHGNTITSHFYQLMLEENPSLNSVFNQTHQKTGHQAGALAGSLYAYASHIDDLGVLAPAVEKVCHKHANILEAWGVAYWQLANIMIKQEDTLYKSAGPWTSWRDFRISKKVPESEEITSFYLSPADGKLLPSYLPGQYISVATSVPSLHHDQNRQYSLSGAPSPQHYRISVKRESAVQKGDLTHPAYISNILHGEKQEGDILQVSHPYGEFFADPKNTGKGALVLISAGVGITPMISILDTFTQENSDRRISFIHATRSSGVQAFGSHVRDITSSHSNVSATIFNKLPAEEAKQGVDFDFATRMDLDVLEKKKDLCLQDKEACYYICGPSGFMTDMGNKLKSFGVEDARIKLEIFGTGNMS
ncbi:flavohemo protein [Aureobasidium pullulans]|uniref:nitric oxide dioxygenase n=1 Tax=Aureobasidium pullulans TaxID=5580 RepID=A0A4S8Z0A6_AURPU|nr:flavohemo protein [Aureobasidium pullulans]